MRRKIVNRVRELNRGKIYEELQKFKVGEQVEFKNREGTRTIIRINQKTLTIKTKEGYWYVEPRNVTKVIDFS